MAYCNPSYSAMLGDGYVLIGQNLVHEEEQFELLQWTH
jgi:hypothetical protein